MSRPKPGIGRELRRTFGHAKVHSQSSGGGTIQLAPVVSHYVASSRSTSSSSVSASASTSTSTSELGSDSTTIAGQFSHLALIPTWDTLDSLIPITSLRESNIVIPYRPGRRSLAPAPTHSQRTSTPRPVNAFLAPRPRPARIGETLLLRQDSRTYTSSTAPLHHAAMDIQMPFPTLSIPPSILVDPCASVPNGTAPNTSSNHPSTWPFDFLWSSLHHQHQVPLEQELGLVPQPPSPGPGTVKTREIPETHTVLSPSTPAIQQQSSPSHALLTHYAMRLPSNYNVQAIPSPPDSQASTSYSSSLEFRIGASGLAKIRPPPTPPRAGSSSRERPPPPRTFVLPDIEPPATLSSEQVGEDAYFTRPDSMCIADGVGGWALSGRGGANAARWSRLLTHFVREEVDSWWRGDPVYTDTSSSTAGGDKEKRSWSDKWRDSKTREDDGMGLEEGVSRRKLDPVEIMQRGFEKCLSCVMAEGIRGSSTCILALLYHSTLLLANLGDCALLLIRNGEVILRTSEMQHAFNHPLQVGTHSRDEPMKDAMSWSVPVEREDVVVLGSDGLMDNMYDEDILDVLATFAPPHSIASQTSSTTDAGGSESSLPKFDPQSVSDALCARAREISEQTGATSPFMERAIEEGIDFVGGKKDDITVVVGVVGQRNP